MTAHETRSAGADQIAWNLGDLYFGPDDPAIPEDMTEAEHLADEFAAEFRGRVAALNAEELSAAVAMYEQIVEMAAKPAEYAEMLWSTDTADAPRGALKARIDEWGAQLRQRLLFFELEWMAAPDGAAAALLEDPLLAHYRHWLELKRLQKPHRLGEAEEKILAEKAVTGRKAWVRLMDEVSAATRYEFDGEMLSFSGIFNKLFSPDRGVRRRAYLSIYEAEKQNQHTMAFLYNTVVADKASDDRLRHYPTWITSRNQENEVSDAAVDALVEAVVSRYDLAQRVFRLKRDLLGLDDFYLYDFYAPVTEAEQFLTWDNARAIVTDAFTRFDPDFAAIVARFFEDRWIDAAPAPNKQSGAYCAVTVPSAHPYVFLSFTGTVRDVSTLAHELGHGVHFYLSREQGQLQFLMPLTIAETGSVFGEMLVVEDMLARESDPAAQLALIIRKLERSVGTVFTQIAYNRFEHMLHTARREEGELSPDRLGDLWIEARGALAGDAMTLTDEARIGWTVPHFMWEPGYVYAYAFGELLTQALFARYRQMGAPFVPLYKDLLRAGGSDWPENLLTPLGVDLTDPGFWHEGLGQIETLIAQAEALSAKIAN